ncbi:DinB family protein [Phycisphaerae bacterium RAS1]|nr:DinB family protein [Phycisphaerae bacterium RAS1]
MSSSRANVPGPWLTIRTLFAHHDWARDKLLSVAATLSDAQLDAGVAMGLGSLRDTLHHLWAAEAVWLERWKHVPQARLAEHSPRLPVDELGQRWRATSRERDDLLQALDDAAIQQPLTYSHPDGNSYSQRLGDQMMHVCNHAVHHRAQALNMLRRCGAATPGLDFLFMKLEQPPFLRSAPLDAASLRRYFAYTDWADAKIFDAAGSLPNDALSQSFEIGHGSIGRTLAHMLDTHRWWCENWHTPDGAVRDFHPSDAASSLREFRELFARTAARRDDSLRGCSNADLQRRVRARRGDERTLEFALGETMLQLCLHGTHHRAQLANMLRQHHVAPPRLDLVLWSREVES